MSFCSLLYMCFCMCRWEVQALHLEIVSSFCQFSNKKCSRLLHGHTLDTGSKYLSCFIYICRYGIKLFSQVSVPREYQSVLGKQWKSNIEGTEQCNLPQTCPSRGHFVHTASAELFSQCSQGDTADLGWSLVVEEFSFVKASEKRDFTLRPYNHCTSQCFRG